MDVLLATLLIVVSILLIIQTKRNSHNAYELHFVNNQPKYRKPRKSRIARFRKVNPKNLDKYRKPKYKGSIFLVEEEKSEPRYIIYDGSKFVELARLDAITMSKEENIKAFSELMKDFINVDMVIHQGEYCFVRTYEGKMEGVHFSEHTMMAYMLSTMEHNSVLGPDDFHIIKGLTYVLNMGSIDGLVFYQEMTKEEKKLADTELRSRVKMMYYKLLSMA